MSNIKDRDYYLETALGNLRTKDTCLRRISRNDSVGTSFVPLSPGGLCVMRKPSTAALLRVKAGNAADTSAGAGARTVLIEGVGPLGDGQTEILTTNGTSAGTNSLLTYIRLNSVRVVTSGVYGTSAVDSHVGDIVIEDSAGSEDWAKIDATDYPRGMSEQGCQSSINAADGNVITDIYYSVDTSKVTDIIFLKRDNILNESAPFSPFKQIFALNGLITNGSIFLKAPLVFDSQSDLMILGKVDQSTAAITIGLGVVVRFND